MTQLTCENCGGSVLYEAGSAPHGTTTICPRCSSVIPVTMIETAVEGHISVAGGSPTGFDAYRTGTIMLRPEDAIEEAPSVEVKVKGFLTQDGLPPDEADYRLRGDATVVGRREGQIILDDPSVSARHFQVEEFSGRFFIRDLKSSNGTFLNGRMVRSAQLRSGDRIQAGSTLFTFSVRHTIPT